MDVAIELQPFELNPHMSAEGETIAEHIQKKYGASAERSAATRQAIKDAGAALGLLGDAFGRGVQPGDQGGESQRSTPCSSARIARAQTPVVTV